jgi:peptidoglycan L-alanyl-D-glutamate endopeptidase CwlK
MDNKSEEKLSHVCPELAEKVRDLIAIAEGEGHALRVIQGLRTFAEQDALFNQPHDHKDNDGDGKVDEADEHVTNARAGQSNHNFGVAVDVAFVVNGSVSWDDNLYSKLGPWAAQTNLAWGGNWRRFKDLPHLELPSLPKPVALIAWYKQGGLQAVWSHVVNEATSVPTVPRTLKLGDVGEDVRELQKVLKLDEVDIDGIFGPATQKAVIGIQHTSNLREDGIVGPNTRAALGLK